MAERQTPLLIVTTRSRLRGARFFPAMFWATRRVRRQLAHTDGLVRWASLIAGPTEFWTITVWRSRHAMQEFARSDAHGEIMWRFSHWLRSLWLMRWRPGQGELGSWSGVTLAPHQVSAGGANGGVLHPSLAQLPTLAAAVGPDGMVAFDNSRLARRSRELVSGAGGMVVRIHRSWLRLPWALAELVRLRRRLAAQDQPPVRSVVGVGRRGAVYLLAVWSQHADPARFLADEWVQRASRRWGDGLWVGEWLPENEYGHWDGMRLRRRRGQWVREKSEAKET